MNRKFTLYVLAITALLGLSIYAGCSSDSSSGPKEMKTADMAVVVTNEFGNPVIGARLTTNPPTVQVITDENGRAVFEDIPVQNYMVYLRRTNFPVYSQAMKPANGNSEDITFSIPTEEPRVSIQYPEDGNFLSLSQPGFRGSAIDAEDGDIPDSLYVWTSSIDGELGRGAQINPGALSAGNHTITLSVADSDGKTKTVSISITLVNYNPESYFPVFNNADWMYTHITEKFSIVNDSDNIENWTLNDISVSIDENNVRTSIMSYSVQIISKLQEYRYTIKDQLDIRDGSIVVTTSTENIKIWDGKSFGAPSDELDIVTTYNPEFVVLQNLLDPRLSDGQSTSHHLSVIWSYYDPFYGIREFTESFHIDSQLSLGAEEQLSIAGTEFNTVPLTITQGNSQRTWWLAKGIGIVKFNHNMLHIPPDHNFPTARLTNTNLSGLAGKRTGALKTARPFGINALTPANRTPVPAEYGIERMKALRTILSEFAPR